MVESLRNLKQEQLIGILFVVVLHGAALYELWSYRIIPTPDEAITLMVNLINPPPPAQPKPPKPEPPKPVKPLPPEPPPPEHLHLAAEAPVVLPDEPVVYVPPAPPPPPPPPAPVVVAPPLPPQPVVLSSELLVVCPERSPPEYPSLSMRMNEQGKVVLRVELGEDGSVSNLEIKTSSGFRHLDDAALSAVKTWHCKPAIRNGKPARAIALQPFNFILEGR